MKNNIFSERLYYQPFAYPFAFEAFEIQNQIHWIAEEISLAEDIKDWNFKLTEDEKKLLTNIFRLFTQMDVMVASIYYDKYIPLFKHPELRMMLGAFAAMEGTHINAYALLIETLGMPESEFKEFMEYKEMRDKAEYLLNLNKSDNNVEDILLNIVSASVFGEGLQLFASFAILLNFSRFSKMKGMGQIVTFSIRDEDLHVESMIKVFKQIIKENKSIWTDELKSKIYTIATEMVDLEDKFIDLSFGNFDIEGLTKDEIKQYIRYIADRRLLQIGMKPLFKVKDNPLEWLSELLSSVEHTNFFENRVTTYSKGALTGTFSNDVWGKYGS